MDAVDDAQGSVVTTTMAQAVAYHRRGRIVCWFSCGAPSAVAAKLAIAAGHEVVVAYCEVKEEHPDNMRFLKDVEAWLEHPVLILGNDEYGRSAREVWRRTRFLVGPTGARCTTELKKRVRQDFGRPDDILVMGYTSEEVGRVKQFEKQNPELHLWPILVESGLTRADCLALIERAGIDLPVMYRLGYHNNNCIGCVKGQAGYWNKIRQDFPEVFAETADIERDLGRAICKREWVENGERKLERVRLDELPEDLGDYPSEPDIQCGLMCALAEEDWKGN